MQSYKCSCLNVTLCSKYKDLYLLWFKGKKNKNSKNKGFLLGVDGTKYAPIQQVNVYQLYFSL